MAWLSPRECGTAKAPTLGAEEKGAEVCWCRQEGFLWASLNSVCSHFSPAQLRAGGAAAVSLGDQL